MSDLNQGTWAENIGNTAPKNTTGQGTDIEMVDLKKEDAPQRAPQTARSGTGYSVIRGMQPEPDTEETKRMKESFGFFGPVTFLYAVFYAFCMYRNGSGVTFPFFVAGSLLFLYFSLSKLGTTLKSGSVFYMTAMVLLGVSTFCTDDGRLIFFNKLGIFLLMMSLLLKQFFDTSGWNLGKFLISIFQLVFLSFGEIDRPFDDFARYRESSKKFSRFFDIFSVLYL